MTSEYKSDAPTPPIPSLAKTAALASMGVALSLIIVKLIAWRLSGSVALLGSLFDSALDLMASAVAFIGVKMSAEPADRDHRFGHGKAEAIASLTQSVIIALSALFIARESFVRLIDPAPLAYGGWALAAMTYSLVATAGLATFQTYALRRTGSLAVEADRAHYIGDLASNAGILLAIVLATQFGWLRADGVGGLAVAALLLWTIAGILRKTLPQLMDQELSGRDRRRIVEIVKRHPRTFGLHALRTRRASAEVFIQFHLELDPKLPLAEAHQIADEVEAMLREVYPRADILVHQDPYGLTEEHDDFGRASALSDAGAGDDATGKTCDKN